MVIGDKLRLLHEHPEYVARQEETEIAHSDEAGLQARQECNDQASPQENAQSARCARRKPHSLEPGKPGLHRAERAQATDLRPV